MRNKQKKSLIAPLFITIFVIAGGVILASLAFFLITLDEFPLTPYAFLYLFGALAVIGGIITAFVLRIKEIKGGEEDEARKY